jgi:hypothetical protein
MVNVLTKGYSKIARYGHLTTRERSVTEQGTVAKYVDPAEPARIAGTRIKTEG